ncbi:hypothetical protein [Chryseobacterium sp.]|uniref:hypothetical protein n=1 Tax=Chryseobacterium sp. TaxID=1871047 RepID=UPI002FCA9432
MKKTLTIISSILLIGCTSTNDLIYSQDENIPYAANLNNSLSSAKLLANNLSEITVMELDLNKTLLQPSGGGCSFTAGHSIDNLYTSTAAFGPNPLTFFGHIFRGFGKPRTDEFNWKGIRFRSGNRPKTIINRGQPTLVDDPFENALSIEFSFQANATYEITLDTIIEDFIYTEQHDQYDQYDDYHGLQQSQAFPTLALELKDTPIIPGNNPCGGRPNIGRFFTSPYFKKQKAEITATPSYEQKTFVFKFSITEVQNALIIYFLPEHSGTTPQYIPESSFNMFLRNIKIVQKPFEQPSNPNPCPSGMRNCK